MMYFGESQIHKNGRYKIMKKENKNSLIAGVSLLTVFVVWTLLVLTQDVAAIGPSGSCVGFSTINAAVRDALGVNMTLYVITDLLGFVPLCIMLVFAVVGLFQ